jgi:hypothetical protein
MFSLKSNLIIAFIALSAFSVVVNAQKKNETGKKKLICDLQKFIMIF